MLLEILAELGMLALLVGCGYVGIRAYVGLRQPRFAALLTRRRLAVLASFMLLVVCAKLLEDVLTGDSGPMDKSALLLMRAKLPAWLGPFFSAVTVETSAAATASEAIVSIASNRRPTTAKRADAASAGFASAPRLVGYGMVLGVELSERAHATHGRGFHGFGAMRSPDCTALGELGDGSSARLDGTGWGFPFGPWSPLAHGRSGGHGSGLPRRLVRRDGDGVAR